MDPLSISASAIAVGTLVQSTLVTLNSLVKDYKTFPKELATLGTELQSLSLVINTIEKSIKGNSHLLQPLDNKHLVNALSACYPTLKAIKTKCKEIKRSAAQGSLNKLMVGVFWSSTRKELQEMRSSLESNKTTLMLSLQLKSLELHISATDQKGKEDQTKITWTSYSSTSVGPADETQSDAFGSSSTSQSKTERWQDWEWEDKSSKGKHQEKDDKWGDDDNENNSEKWDSGRKWKNDNEWTNYEEWQEGEDWNEDKPRTEKNDWKEDVKSNQEQAWTENNDWERDENPVKEQTWNENSDWQKNTKLKQGPAWKNGGETWNNNDWKTHSSDSHGAGKPQWENENGFHSGDFSTSSEGQSWSGNDDRTSTTDSHKKEAAESEFEIQTHQSFGDWRSTFGS